MSYRSGREAVGAGAGVSTVALLMPLLMVGVTDVAPVSALSAVSSPIRATHAEQAQTFTTPGAMGSVVARDGYTVVAPTPRLIALRESNLGLVARPAVGPISAQGGFGARMVPGCADCSTMHAGVDFAAARGSDARSVLDGDVIAAGPSGGYGNMVLVRHATGLVTRYGHLDSIIVHVGEHISAGTTIGLVGSTGVSTGPHLHFEVIEGGAPTDPVPWLHARGIH